MSPNNIQINTGNYDNSRTELRYSPMTPNYNQTPGKSPSSRNHLGNMSPNFNYGSSPYYSADSQYESPNRSSTTSPLGSDPENMANHIYNPESPSY